MKPELVKVAREFLDAFGGNVPDWLSEDFAKLETAVMAEEAVARAEATDQGDALMFGIAGLRRGRFAGKVPELGMGYGGQQAPKGDPYEAFAESVYMQNLSEAVERMETLDAKLMGEKIAQFWGDQNRTVKIITDEDRERYRKEKTARPGLGYSMGADTFHAQMRHAAMWERSHNEALRAAGWQWDAERQCWWHFWQPGTYINPG